MAGYDIMNEYKSESSRLRTDIDSLLNQLIDRNEDVLLEVQPDLIEDYRTLKGHIQF